MNRYSSAALTGDFGALQTVLAYEFENYKSFGAAEHDDGQIVYLGGNYDCGFAKTFVMGQYFKGIKAGQLTAITEDDADHFDTANSKDYSADGVKGYGLHLGTIVPVAGGDLTVGTWTSRTSPSNMLPAARMPRATPSVPSTSTTSPSARPSTRVPASLRSSMTMKAPTRRLRPTSV